MSRPERDGIAVHETGHAVAGYLLGRRPDWVTIRPSADYRGLTSYVPRAGGPVDIPDAKPVGWPIIGMGARSRRAAEAEIVLTLAGIAAERVYMRDADAPARGFVNPDPDWSYGFVNDEQAVFEMAVRHSPAAAHELIAYLNAVTLDLVRQPVFTALLVPLRDALLEHETLPGVEVRRLLRVAKRIYDEGNDRP